MKRIILFTWLIIGCLGLNGCKHKKEVHQPKTNLQEVKKLEKENPVRICRYEQALFNLPSDSLEEGLKNGVFPDSIKNEFRRGLDYFGQSPIIVRSSSLLEDGFGNAFAGKYESVFCVNRGTLEERLEFLVKDVKTYVAGSKKIKGSKILKQQYLDIQ